MVEKKMLIAIVGGGIGGLGAALSLLQAGVDVHVYEQAQAIHEVGAGIAVSPNATRILHRLGLGDTLKSLGVQTHGWRQRRWEDGKTLVYSELGEKAQAEFGQPLYHMHRADLLNALAQALPAERLHTNNKFKTFIDHGDHVEVVFENGLRISVDGLVGADGIHSMVCRELFEPEKPQYSGYIAYRGLVPAERLTHLDIEVSAQIWMGPGKVFVHYYVQNQRLLSYLAVLKQETWSKESWNDRGNVADVRAAYKDWHPQVRGILEEVEEAYIWALIDRKPMQHWSVGRVTLLGDACHAMLPHMAQGAAQAIEDGATLSVCLSQGDRAFLPEALRMYEDLRLPRVTRIQSRAAANKLLLTLPDGPAQEARDAEMAQGGYGVFGSKEAVSWLYGFDAGAPISELKIPA